MLRAAARRLAPATHATWRIHTRMASMPALAEEPPVQVRRATCAPPARPSSCLQFFIHSIQAATFRELTESPFDP